MQRGNIVRNGVGAPKSWKKCTICGKVLKGDRRVYQHHLYKHQNKVQ